VDSAGCRSLMGQYQFGRTALAPGYLRSAPGSFAVLRVSLEFDVQAARKAAEFAVEIRKRAVLHVDSLDLVVVGAAIGSAAEGIARDAAFAHHTEAARIAVVAVGTDHTVLGRILAVSAAAEFVRPDRIALAAAAVDTD
jgi:hypothetical protein